MQITPNIGIETVGVSASDKDIDFEAWRQLVNGETNSMATIVDEEIGKLKNTIKTTGLGDKYLSDDGTYRYVSGGSGTSKVAFASDSYLVYTATTDTTTFTIPNMSTNKSVELIKDNLVMMQGQDYSIDKSTGVITLSFTLKSGERIYYSVIEGEEKAILYSDDSTIEANREKCLTDISGNFIAPKTTIVGVEGLENALNSKLNKSDVVANVSTGVVGKALDATIGKSLSEQINVLKTLIEGKEIISDLDTFKVAGKTGYFNSVSLNTPFVGDGTITFHPYGENPNFGFQLVQGFDTSLASKMTFRNLISGAWQPWQPIVTTSQWKSTSSNLVNGWTAWGSIYYPVFTRAGNVVTVSNGCIGGGTVTSGTIILTAIPTEYRPNSMRLATLEHNVSTKGMAIVGTDGAIKIDTSWGGSWLSTGLYDMNFSYYLT